MARRSGGLVWSTAGGYLHQDYEVQRQICRPGPYTCRAVYSEVLFGNAVTGKVERALVMLGPGPSLLDLMPVGHNTAGGA